MSEYKKIINDNEEIKTESTTDNEEIKTESTTNEESVNNDVVIEEVAENNNGESEEIVQSEEVAEKGIKTKIKKFKNGKNTKPIIAMAVIGCLCLGVGFTYGKSVGRTLPATSRKYRANKVIATVGDTKITGEQLRQKMEPLFYINAKTKMTDEEIDANEASFIDYMTTTEVLYLEGKAEGIKVEKEDIENEYSTLMSSLQQTYNITEDELINKCNITKEDIEKVSGSVEKLGLRVNVVNGATQSVIGIIGDTTKVDPESIEVDPAVEKVMHVSEPYKLANRAFHPEDSVIDVGGVKIGGGHLAVIAGPCSVESKEQVIEIAKAAKAAGANLLRGGAFKPRTSPYAFQGMGSAGLDILVAAKEATGLPIVSELMDAEYLDEFIEKVDLIQIGARNMQNFDLLKKVGKATKKPILLKRGLSATFQEWIMSAEYIMASGNPNVILCERGVRTFESYTRNTLDLQAVPVIKELTHLPIIIDPSHAGGKWWLVNPMAKAAVAAGCDGLMIEVHNNPEKALCDGPQSLKPAKFEQLMKELKPIADAVGKEI